MTNVLLLSIDSLRRDFLSAYADTPRCVDYDVETPNIDRFADRAAVFDTHYAGSLPCMPARREWHAGVQEFLWRPWGPIEPSDDHLARVARDEEILTQLITDHFHYFQHGAHGYYEDYTGFEFVRGHEYDAWQTAPRHPNERLLGQTIDPETDPPDGIGYVNRSVYARNAERRGVEDDERNAFAPRVFSRTADWLRENREWDRWLCYVDSFDVHEPFHNPEPYASLYTDEDPRDPVLDVWPYYGRVDEGQSELTDRQLEFVRSQFAGKVTMADTWFGRVLDALDDGNLWDDTAVIVTSDHGFLLGEHGWVGKNHPPVYDVLANTPLFVWHPDGAHNGERIESLTSAVDLYATVLDLLGVGEQRADRVHSRSLQPLLSGDADADDLHAHRDRALYGYWGSAVNVTDGEYTYLHPCDPSVESYCHSTTMMNARGFPLPTTPKTDAEAGEFVPHAEGPVWRFAADSHAQLDGPELYDVREDPTQQENRYGDAPDATERMRSELVEELARLDAPDQQLERLDLTPPS
jgi:arylsulfatase A-like enzyme